MNLLKTKKSLNQEKTFYVDYKISKNGTTIEVFSILFVTFNKKYNSIKSIHQNRHSSDFKIELLQKLQEWSTEDVDGVFISLILYENTESSIILFKRWGGDFRKEEYCQTYQHCFYLEELTQIEWSIRKKNNGSAYETVIEGKEHHFDYCFEFDTITKSRFVRISFNQLTKFKRLPVV